VSVTPESLTHVWERNRAALVTHARAFVTDADHAEDLTQDLITTALKERDSYRGSNEPRQVRAWLIGILNNLCRQALTVSRRETVSIERLAAHLEAERGRLGRGALYDAAIWLLRVGNLTALQTYIVRSRLDGHTLRAIAIHLRADVRTVRHHLDSAVAALRACPYNDFAGADLDATQRRSPQRITLYHRTQRTGAGLARRQLANLK
jgi:DNA-directed RNA polymerase specialized sigma24 family protein